MDIRPRIKRREYPDSIAVVNESVKSVAEKWNDGLVRETDNLQLVLRNNGSRPLRDVYVYLRYLDRSGNELGHEFDMTQATLKPGAEGRVSLMLVPPDEFSDCALTILADEEGESRNSKLELLAATAFIVGIVLLKYFGFL